MVTDGVGNSNGVLQPFSQLGWWKWMYYLSPYTYLVEALMGNGKRLFHPHRSDDGSIRNNIQDSEDKRSPVRTLNTRS